MQFWKRGSRQVRYLPNLHPSEWHPYLNVLRTLVGSACRQRDKKFCPLTKNIVHEPGAPKVGYGTEVVQSFNALIDSIKRRQVLRPRSLFAMCLAGVDFAVKLLPNGFVEVDGVVPPLTVEKEIEDAMKEFGAILEEVLVP